MSEEFSPARIGDGRMRLKRLVLCIALGVLAPVMAPVAAQAETVWTLEQSIRQVIERAPEIRGAQAAVAARQGALQQAGAWPNPQIEVRVDDKMGKDDGRGGSDFTQFAISQPLPVSGRIGHQQAVAGAQLDAARAARRFLVIELEAQAAQRYHALQFSAQRLQLAQQRLQLADELQTVGRRRERAGELARLERLRLDLIRESAQQALDKAEGAYNEAVGRFRAYLQLPGNAQPRVTPLKAFGPLPALHTLERDLPRHAALQAARFRLAAARSGVRLARAERLPDPALRLFRERDVLGGRRQDVSGIGVVVTLPLWNRNNGRIAEARAQTIEAQSKLQALERDLRSRLQKSYLHLRHLVQQGEHYRTRVFVPARKVFDLTRKAYATGEVELLTLIDANNTYFDAYERYLELLEQAWLEAAELRLAAGRVLVAPEQDGLK